MTTKIFISFEEFTKQEFNTYIEQNPTHEIILWVPENSYIPQIYKTYDEWVAFSVALDENGINYTVVTGDLDYYKGHPNVIGWEDFTAYQVFYHFKQGLIYHEKSNYKHAYFVSRNGRETLESSIMIDSLYKYKLDNDSVIQYYNNGAPFKGFENWQPTYWDGIPIGSPPLSPGEYNAPTTYEFASVDVCVAKQTVIDVIDPGFVFPMLWGMPSVIFAKAGMYDKMERILGVALYRDMIDTSFDSIEDDRERADAISAELRKLLKSYSSPDLIFKIFGPIAELNRQHLFKLVRQKNVHQKIKELIELPELHAYKEILNIGDKISLIGKNIY